MRDIASNIAPAVSVAPDGNRTANLNGAGVDRRGYDSVAALVHFGTITDGGWTPSLEESDDDSTYTAVAADDLVGSFSEATSADSDTIQEVGYVGTKRYVRVVVTESSASTTGAKFSAAIVRGHAHQRPA